MKLSMQQSLAPCLWFDGQAEAAVKFYTSIFPRSKVVDVLRWGDVGPGPKGSVLMITFELMGQTVLALNGGPEFRFTPAISLSVLCETQAEVDRYWKKLSAGGQEMQCAWLTDKYGVSWQIVPRALVELLRDKDRKTADRAMQSMMGMVKIDIAELKRAAKGGAAKTKPQRARRR